MTSPEPEPGALDFVGWYIATLHALLGHDKAAAVLGFDPGDQSTCLICAYDANPTDETRRVMLTALGPE